MSKFQRKKSKTKCESPLTSTSKIIEDNSNKFDIKISKNVGRYMVAKNQIKAGEIILKENPLVVGPYFGKIQCLGCYENLEKTKEKFKCKNCNWPSCSLKCPGDNYHYGHTKIECKLLKKSNSAKFLNWENLENMKINYYSIVPLRCLLLKSTDEKNYENLMKMENHNEIRKNIPELWLKNQKFIVDKIIKEWKLTEFKEEEIHTICGVLEVNSFEIGCNLRGIYPNAFLMSHDCVPNTNHNDDGKDFTLTVRASLDIPKNYPITLSYAYTLQDTWKRREHLLENKFFECFCKRCKDPTELNTNIGALLCPKCKIGLILSKNPFDQNSIWICNNNNKNQCIGYQLTSNSIKLLMNRITKEYENIDCNDINSLENFLEKYRNVLHKNHYINLNIKLLLSQLYGRINNYLISDLTDELIIRKIKICKEILEIFDIIEPGLTKLRGVTLYELHAPLMILLTRNFENKKLNKNQIKLKLKEIVELLNESKEILKFESINTPEYQMSIAAEEALIQIKNWEKIIGKINI